MAGDPILQEDVSEVEAVKSHAHVLGRVPAIVLGLAGDVALQLAKGLLERPTIGPTAEGTWKLKLYNNTVQPGVLAAPFQTQTHACQSYGLGEGIP
jgi:hypothetical protein